MFRLSPSDFAFLWEQCKRCFYLKVAHGIRQPSMPMAGIFKRIEGLQMDLYDGKPTKEVLPELPPGIIRCGEKTVESEPIQAPGSGEPCYIYGKIDSLLEFEDGSWGILDFKTTQVKPEKAALYGRQLHAYAHAFEHPAAKPQILRGKAPGLSPITKLGLLCFEPSELSLEGGGRHTYRGDVKWIEIPRDGDAFLTFVGETVKLLQGGTPPPTPGCNWCEYARTMKAKDFDGAAAKDDAPAAECPKCGSPMRERNGKYGRFLGCSKYPECRGTLQISG